MKNLINTFFPRVCCGCGKVGDYLCFDCKKTLLPHPEICPVCHSQSANFKTCITCTLEGKTFLDGLIIGFSYQLLLKKLIFKLKFYHKKDVAQFLAKRAALLVQLNPYLMNILEEKKMGISFVPSHRYRKYFQKGYNQSEILADLLAQELGIPMVNCFKKNRITTSQVKLNREERLKNLNSAFIFNDSGIFSEESTLLIIDDVTTTGATLNELAKTVKLKRPDLKVWGIVLARHTG